jgi:hypothetical protein
LRCCVVFVQPPRTFVFSALLSRVSVEKPDALPIEFRNPLWREDRQSRVASRMPFSFAEAGWLRRFLANQRKFSVSVDFDRIGQLVAPALRLPMNKAILIVGMTSFPRQRRRDMIRQLARRFMSISANLRLKGVIYAQL